MRCVTEALAAMEIWRRENSARENRVEEYRRIAEDLREEVLEYLETSNQC